jgi:hypothetical protein
MVVSGRPDWTSLDSFATQCQLDPNTRGALVLETSIAETYRNNYFLIVANFTTASAAIEILGCGSEDHTPAASPLSLVSRNDVTGKAHQDAWTFGIFTTLATLFRREWLEDHGHDGQRLHDGQQERRQCARSDRHRSGVFRKSGLLGF